eukprot:TRINITY_DN73641_c0_g1_i1.p1 TRINITY_DN73641_c0_g1~~TRINITY_DN73641_c0_g1_i1.p1  ORF type:complete len:1166 (+),score=234.90 TRINITY_DN73641_c0_g1_i1:90-3587(+)
MALAPSVLVGTAPAPVPLSTHAELERQDKVALALTSLLVGAAKQNEPLLSRGPASWVPALAAAATKPQPELEAWAEETERLRCVVHLNDVDHCKSQHRLVSVSFACANDPELSEAEASLRGASEVERQHFYKGVYDRVLAGNFAGFGFPKEAFLAALDEERERRTTLIAGAVERLHDLQALCEPCYMQRLGDCGEAIANFPWASISASQEKGDGRWLTKIDALTLENVNDLWLVAEAKPAVTGLMLAQEASARPSVSVARDVLLVVDLSGSMCDILPVLKECLHDVIAHANEGDRLCLIGFSCEPSLLCDWVEIGCDAVGVEARRALRSCVDSLEAGGGTRIVPALRFALQQLRARPATLTSLRRVAVVLLSDGDPEEPADALSSSAARCFAAEAAAHSESENPPLVVAMALGEESRPDLMALLAQCGCGASLYISSQAQLPAQLGRMWGILGGVPDLSGVEQLQTGGLLTKDAFLILEPAEGTEIIETERSPGGVVSLTASDGRRLTVLRCGRHRAPEDCWRFAARFRLPAWARAPIDSSNLQRPLMRATWVWQEHCGALRAASDVLRPVQVPALLIEARVGLPLRIVLAADANGCENFDRERFIGSLAAALGVDGSQLSLDRLTPGSIIADLRLLDGSPIEAVQKIRSAHASGFLSGAGGAEVGCSGDALRSVRDCIELNGFGAVAEVMSPGVGALQRVLQWRLASALEAAAAAEAPNATSVEMKLSREDSLTTVRNALASVVALATSPVVRMCDPDLDTLRGGAAAAAADAQAALGILDTRLGQTSLEMDAKHALEQHAYAHTQQICPELRPAAASAHWYEAEPLRAASAAFQANAEVRETAVPPSVPLLWATESTSGVVVRVRSGDIGAAAAAVVAFKITVHCGVQSETLEFPVGAGAAAADDGIIVDVHELEAGAEHALIAFASNSREWSAQSAPLLCRLTSKAHVASLPGATLGSGAGAASRRSMRQRRASSIGKVGAEIIVTEASATAAGTLSLAWEASLQMSASPRWDVTLECQEDERPSAVLAEQAEKFSQLDLVEPAASFIGLTPSRNYRFHISVSQSQLDADGGVAQAVSRAPTQGRGGVGISKAGGLDLSVQGVRMDSPSARAQPRPAEGVAAIPPFAQGTLAALRADPWLKPFDATHQGIFLRLRGRRVRSS